MPRWAPACPPCILPGNPPQGGFLFCAAPAAASPQGSAAATAGGPGRPRTTGSRGWPVQDRQQKGHAPVAQQRVGGGLQPHEGGRLVGVQLDPAVREQPVPALHHMPGHQGEVRLVGRPRIAQPQACTEYPQRQGSEQPGIARRGRFQHAGMIPTAQGAPAAASRRHGRIRRRRDRPQGWRRRSRAVRTRAPRVPAPAPPWHAGRHCDRSLASASAIAAGSPGGTTQPSSSGATFSGRPA